MSDLIGFEDKASGRRYLFTGASGNPAGPNVTEYGHSFTLVQEIRTVASG